MVKAHRRERDLAADAGDVEAAEYRRNVAAIEAVQQVGKVRADIPAAELLAMVVALAISWETASWSLKTLQPSGVNRRASVTAAVASLMQPMN